MEHLSRKEENNAFKLPEKFVIINEDGDFKKQKKVYDLTNFKHPGGSVFYEYMNRDATIAFQQFHKNNPRALKYIKTLKSYPVTMFADQLPKMTPQIAKAEEDFQNFANQLDQEGFYKPSYVQVFLRCFELVMLFYVGYYLMSKGYLLTGFFLGVLSGGRAGWVQHEGGHHSLTTIGKIDKFIQKVAFGFGLGLGHGQWNRMHNKHHAAAQKINFDPDTNTLPVVCFNKLMLTKGDRHEYTPLWWIKYQHYTFYVCSAAFNALFWNLYLFPREYLFRKFEIVTVISIASRYTIHLVVLAPIFGYYQAFVILLAQIIFSGIYLFFQFSLSHSYLPVVEEKQYKSWVEYALVHSIDVYPSYFVNYIMGYLNCQVLHHMFPQMPQFQQPQLMERIQQFADRNNMEYRRTTYWQACKMTYQNLKNVAELSAKAVIPDSKVSLKIKLLFIIFVLSPTFIFVLVVEGYRHCRERKGCQGDIQRQIRGR